MSDEPGALSADPYRFDGLESDFLALDADGYVAFLTASGHGPVPAAVGDRERHWEAITAVRASPPSSSIYLVPLFPTDDGTDWQEMAQRGFFAFDADYQGYELRASPACPTHVSALPPAVAAAARDVGLASVRFLGRQQVTFAEVLASAAGA